MYTEDDLEEEEVECFFCGEYHDQELWGENCPYMGIDGLFGILDLL